LQLIDDIQKLQPTILTLVPRVLSKITSAIQSATIDAPGFKGKLSRAALAAKYARMDGPANTFNHPVWDRLWSRKIRQVLGGKVRIIVSGSAPASRDTLRFLRAALACDVVEGYTYS
jgi:long-chain acyl-CoA synthetase